MKIDKEKVIEHAEDVVHVLGFIAGLLGTKGEGAQKALAIAGAALHALEESMHGKPVDVEERIKALRTRLADNDAAADQALAAKFDHGGEG